MSTPDLHDDKSADVVCHTLVRDCGSRRVSYVMFLIEELDIDQKMLTETVQWYELESAVAAMYRPFQGEFNASAESPAIIPSEAEFISPKDKYNLTNLFG